MWQRIGYALTALWMIAVLAITGEDVHDPLFNFIFIVPLAGWIIGIAAGRLVNRRWPAPAEAKEHGRPPRRPP